MNANTEQFLESPGLCLGWGPILSVSLGLGIEANLGRGKSGSVR